MAGKKQGLWKAKVKDKYEKLCNAVTPPAMVHWNGNVFLTQSLSLDIILTISGESVKKNVRMRTFLVSVWGKQGFLKGQAVRLVQDETPILSLNWTWAYYCLLASYIDGLVQDEIFIKMTTSNAASD